MLRCANTQKLKNGEMTSKEDWKSQKSKTGCTVPHFKGRSSTDMIPTNKTSKIQLAEFPAIFSSMEPSVTHSRVF